MLVTELEPILRILKYEPTSTTAAAATPNETCGITVPATDTLIIPVIFAYPVVLALAVTSVVFAAAVL